MDFPFASGHERRPQTCPVIPGARVIDWPLPDPKGQPVERVREIRDEVRRRVEALVAEHGWRDDAARGAQGGPP